MSHVDSPNEVMPPATVFYSVVVPVFNSAPTLSRLHRRLAATMEALGRPFELIFVDDASVDASWAALADIARGDPRVVAVQLAHNVGQGSATLAGMRCSAGDILITLDDDLQHPPEEIPKLLARLDGPDGFDAVFGVPTVRRHSLWRRIGSWLNNLIFSAVLRKPWGLRASTFRAMQRSVLLRLQGQHWPEGYVSSIALRGARQIGTVQVEHAGSALPRSRYSLGKLLRTSLGFFGALSDRGRKQCALVSTLSGVCLLVLAAAGWRFGGHGFVNGALAAGSCALGVIAFVFGLTVTMVNRRVSTFRRKPLTPVAARRTIAGGREAAGLL